PTKHEEGGKARGEIFAFVTHRPSAKRYHEVSLGMGYPLKEGSEVYVKIGGKTFNFFTHGSMAYARPEDDKPIVKAMRAGSTMVVSGVSARGTKTRDTYSLSGFSKANNAINNKCNVKKP
ncbi:MAG: invasion associated locus B family protein, partial [Alphaproteobacteria bacterium]|nr:invasion associated locus B family protein [Alphaproteobacteria bacterium]